MANNGLAFSGGGIRSAAFCSGVLRRLLERGVEVDNLSCVSGGGYTGTAYLDWKYREERKARMEGEGENGQRHWHEDFFDHMTQRSGYFCNWQKPIKGILDTVVFFFLVILVAIIHPLIKWGSYAFPLAFIIDHFFGNQLNKSDCASGEYKVTGYASTKGNAEAKMYKSQKIEPCLKVKGANENSPIILFAALFILFLISHIFLRFKRSSRRLSVFLRLSQFTFGSFLVFTVIPFTIGDFVVKIPLWAQFLALPIFVIVWIVLPLLRNKTSYVLIIYLYSFVIYWRVYHGVLFGRIAYSDPLFHCGLFCSGFSFFIVPVVTNLQERLVHVYNR